MNVSFVIPVYNNQKSLHELTNAITSLCSKNNYNFEIVFVDDNSIDNSLKTLSSLEGSIKIIHLKQNCGQSTAILIGMRYVTYDTIVVMDADLQDNPAVVPDLIKMLGINTDIVFGMRTGDYEKKLRLFSGKFFKYLLYLLSDKQLPLNAGLFFVITKKASLKLLPYTGSNPYLLSVIAKTKLKCNGEKIHRKPNKFGESNYTSLKRWRIASKGLWQCFSLSEKTFDESKILLVKG